MTIDSDEEPSDRAILDYGRPRVREPIDWICVLAYTLPPLLLIPLGLLSLYLAIASGPEFHGNDFILIVFAIALILFGAGFPLARLHLNEQHRREIESIVASRKTKEPMNLSTTLEKMYRK